MIGLGLGFLCGLVIALVIFFISFILAENFYEHDNIINSIGISIGIVIIIISMFVGVDLEKNNYKNEINKFVISKELIENSLDNEKLGGFERVELVKKAIELNDGLLTMQNGSKYWYGFTIDDDSVNELTPITFE